MNPAGDYVGGFPAGGTWYAVVIHEVILVPLGVMRPSSTGTYKILYGLSHFRPKGRERLDIGTVRIASRNRQQSAFTLSADENETILNAALGLPSIGRKTSDSGHHSSTEVHGRLEPLAVDDFPLRSPYNDVARLGVVLVSGEAVAGHRRIVATVSVCVHPVPRCQEHCMYTHFTNPCRCFKIPRPPARCTGIRSWAQFKMKPKKTRAVSPWDRRPWPAHGDSDENKLYAAVGRALSAWERHESVLSFLFAQLTASPLPWNAMRAYCAVRTFEGRADMLRAISSSYFHGFGIKEDHPLVKTFKLVLSNAVCFSQRRNDIAHGVVDFYLPEKLLPTERAKKNGHALLPALGSLKERDQDGYPGYCYTSTELDYFAECFTALRVPAHTLASQIAVNTNAIHNRA